MQPQWHTRSSVVSCSNGILSHPSQDPQEHAINDVDKKPFFFALGVFVCVGRGTTETL